MCQDQLQGLAIHQLPSSNQTYPYGFYALIERERDDHLISDSGKVYCRPCLKNLEFALKHTTENRFKSS